MAENNENPAAKAKSLVQNRLFPLLVITELIALLLSFSDSVLKLHDSLRQHYYLIVLLIWLTALLFIYKSVFKNKNIKRWLYILVSIVCIAAIGYRIWEVKYRKTYPADQPHINLGLLSLYINYFNSKRPVEAGFKINEFYLNDQICSFTESMEFKFATGPELYRTFEYNQDVNIAFRKGNCTGLNGNRPIQNVLPLLQKRLETINRKDLLDYIKTPADLSRVIAGRGDIFKQLMFTNDELVKMKKDDPVSYETVRDWLVKCIGVKQPVISFVLQNTSAKDILITQLVYEVLEVGQVKGGETGPLYPIITYDHVLNHTAGNQRKILNPALKITKGDMVSFNVRLIPSSNEPGLCWFLKIRVQDSEGKFQRTEPFQIIMSK